METGGLLGVPIIGAVAGWLAGNSMRGGGFGLVGNIVVGLLGALLCGFLIGFLGISSGGFIGSLVEATLAAPVLLFVLGLINKA